jgi:hypothetical protein
MISTSGFGQETWMQQMCEDEWVFGFLGVEETERGRKKEEEKQGQNETHCAQCK